MDNPTRFSNLQDGEEQDSFERTWNDPDALPRTQFNPVTDEFEVVSEPQSGGMTGQFDIGSEPQSEGEGGMGEKVTDLKDKAGQAAATAQEKASAVTGQAHSMSDKGIDSAATGLGQAASMLRQQGDAREGTIGTAATKTADTLEQASSFLQNTDTDQLITDIEAMVRKRPVESVLVAAGIGYLLSKVFS
jgi:ElaB/YqjD/DUF883 family membrane-anchored ribosome-binding protein